jgi:acyl carrier protein
MSDDQKRRERVRVGIDLVDVDDVRDSVARFGDRYLGRIFTTGEVSAAGDGSDIGRLAVTFAAKEATAKVLAAGDQPLPWRSIELTSAGRAAASIRLSGNAAEAADRAGIFNLSVSISRTHTVASAIVIAEATEPGSRVDDQIRHVIAEHAGLTVAVDSLSASDSLFTAGMTSHASVNVMLGLEDAFAVEFPDRMLQRSVFESIDAIRAALIELEGSKHEAVGDGH